MERLTVIVTEPIHDSGLKLLREGGVDIIQLPPGADEGNLQREASRANALITRGGIKVSRAFMESANGLKVVGVHGIGCDHIDLEAATDNGKIVLNTPYALTETVAEMAMALMLSLTRRVVSADKAVRIGQWSRKYSDLRGIEVMGKTIGIIGLGKIGSAIAYRLKPFCVKLIYHSRSRKNVVEKETGASMVSFNELLKLSDIIHLSLPYNLETKHLISRNEITTMKDGVLIINTARGKIIDEEALIEGLLSGKIAGVALDVFETEPLEPQSPLVEMDNVILTPHLAASSEEAMIRMAIQVSKGILKVLKGESPDHLVVP
jgi:D-3-phosphoglycerate dehydrogenase